MRIHQFIPYLHAPGDGAANQVYAFQRAFCIWGYESEIYALEGDPGVSEMWRSASEYISTGRGDADDILLYHYVIGSPLAALLKTVPGQLIIYYQNITPSEYITPFHPELANSMQSGREELQTLRHVPAMAASEYNRSELYALGFQEVEVVPLVLDFERLHTSAQTPAGRALVERYSDGWSNWVSVGRIAPNKRCEDIIKAFAYYRRFVNPRARLFLVGSTRHFEAYQFNLARMVEELDVGEVHWCGRVPYEEGFGAYYQLASVFVYMSEHEGFCAPLLEAMSFDVPVIAYDAAATPFTMGEAGVLVKVKRYEEIAEMVDILQHDESLRSHFIAGQRKRLAEFTPERMTQRLQRAISRFSQEQYGQS